MYKGGFSSESSSYNIVKSVKAMEEKIKIDFFGLMILHNLKLKSKAYK